MSRLVVLGSCGAWPEPGRACSGFMLEHDGFRVVLDLGYGTLSRLLSTLGSTTADGLDAAIVTHRHADHVVDLHGLFRARRYGHPDGPRLPLYAGPGVVQTMVALEAGAIDGVFDVHPLPARPYEVGPFRLQSRPLPHFVPTVGVRLEADGLTVAYTGDTGPDPALAELGRGADLYIVEATDFEPERTASSALNLTGRDAGRVAAEAGARRLLLTHFWPDNDREATRASAAAEFGGEILVAQEGLEIDLP